MRKFDVVQGWLDNVAYGHSNSKSTSVQYRFHFKRFCDFIEKAPQQILEEYNGTTDREFRREYARFLRAFISELSGSSYAPATVQSYIGAVKSFFKYNDLPLGYVPTGKNRVTYHNRDITKHEIDEILKQADRRDRAFFCMMSQSGVRPITLSQLRLKHIEPDFSEGVIPCKIDVPEELAKGKFGAYFTFMGKASVNHLRTYLKGRPGIGKEDYLFTSHGTDKPVNTRSASGIFMRIIEKLKAKGIMDFDQKEPGKPRSVRLYNLRKWFRKQAGHAGSDFVNFWMGHTLGVDEHYFSRDPEHHRQIYADEAMPHLRIETHTPSENEKRIEQLTAQLAKRDEELTELRNWKKEISEHAFVMELHEGDKTTTHLIGEEYVRETIKRLMLEELKKRRSEEEA